MNFQDISNFRTTMNYVVPAPACCKYGGCRTALYNGVLLYTIVSLFFNATRTEKETVIMEKELQREPATFEEIRTIPARGVRTPEAIILAI